MTADRLTSFAENGSIDFIGGYYDSDGGYDEIDALCAFCDRYSLPIDVHVIETDVPLLTPFDYFLDRALDYGFGERITFGHLTALDAPGIDQDAVAAVVEKAAQAQVNVTSLCSCNMYLMGRKADAPRRVGTTRLDLFNEAGVNTSFASTTSATHGAPTATPTCCRRRSFARTACRPGFPKSWRPCLKWGHSMQPATPCSKTMARPRDARPISSSSTAPTPTPPSSNRPKSSTSSRTAKSSLRTGSSYSNPGKPGNPTAKTRRASWSESGDWPVANLRTELTKRHDQVQPHYERRKRTSLSPVKTVLA